MTASERGLDDGLVAKLDKRLATRHPNYAYYLTRLDDLRLLDKAVVVYGDVAVPAGGKRLGGWISVPDHDAGMQAMDELCRHGFTRLRMTQEDGYGPTVEWGDDPPVLDGDEDWAPAVLLHTIACGRFYGYSDTAILGFIESLLEYA